MTWVRKDDQMPINRKVAALSDAAYRLDDEAICWSSRNLTDGRIPAEDLDGISRRATPDNAAELVRRGRWHTHDYECPSPYCPQPGIDGYVIHDYLEYNPSKEEVIEGRAAKAERQRRWREARRRAGSASTPSTGDASTPSTGRPSTRRATASTRSASRDASGDAAPRARAQGAGARVSRPAPPRPAPKQGAGGARPAPNGEAPDARRLAADAAAVEREEEPTPHPAAPPPIADPQRIHELAAQARAAIRSRPRPARGRLPDVAPPVEGLVDNPHYDPAAAARLAAGDATPSPNGAQPRQRGPGPDDEVWLSVRRRGIDAHWPLSGPAGEPGLTACGRSMRTGVLVTYDEAQSEHGSKPCPRCWPAEGNPR